MKPLAYYVGERAYRTLSKLKRFPWAFRLYAESRMAIHAVAAFGPKLLRPHWLFSSGTPPRQQPLRWQLPMEGLGSEAGIRSVLAGRGLHFQEGFHTFYVPPQDGLAEKLGELVEWYPPGSGFKILKVVAPPDRAVYRVDIRNNWVAGKWMGGVLNQMDSANALFLLGLGPRLYDLVELRAGESSLTCFVVEHVKGTPPSREEHSRFIVRLGEILDRDGRDLLAIVTAEEFDDGDFAPPDCNGNLIRRDDDGVLLYVDFQQFRLVHREKLAARILGDARTDFHFGHARESRGGRYLYQSVPGCQIGKRDTRYRQERLSNLLRRGGVDPSGRVVLDLCCNSAMMISACLAQGAYWGIGWDLPTVAPVASRLQYALGNTRMTLIPAHLNEKYPLAGDFPTWLQGRMKEGIVLFLAAWRHIGFPDALASIPWHGLVFEGHETDTPAETESTLRRMEEKWNCRVAIREEIVDGDCGSRSLALLVRS